MHKFNLYVQFYLYNFKIAFDFNVIYNKSHDLNKIILELYSAALATGMSPLLELIQVLPNNIL